MLSPMVFTDFTDVAFYTKTDAYPSPTYATDTTWVLRVVPVPASYNGQVVSFAFYHTANDMDVLYLDEITVIENPTGVAENNFVNGAKLGQNTPNPCNNVSVINYELEKNATVSLTVCDVTGKKVAVQNVGEQNAGKHAVQFDASNLSAGVYYYSLTVGQNTTSAMKMVVIK